MYELSNVSIVIVSFNSEEKLFELFPSIPESCELIIVNNASNSLPQELKKSRDFIEIHNSENKGFGTACNIGVTKASKDFIFLLNPDTFLKDHCLENLLKVCKDFPNASAFTPKITNKKNKEDFKRRSILLNRGQWLKGPPKVLSEIPVMGGAAIFLKKTIFSEVGGFDENIFLYHEDDDLSLRLKNTVGPLMYCPQANVIHEGGNSSLRNPKTAMLKGFHMGKSRVYAMKKYKINNYKVKCLLFAIIQLMSIEMLFSKRKRAKYLAFFKGVKEELKEDKV